MKVIDTNIPDITKENLDKTKIKLANKIIENISPLFEEMIDEKKQSSRKLKAELEQKKKLIKESKEHLELLMKEYNKRKKLLKLTNRLSHLVKSGLTFDSTTKNDTIMLLKVLPKLDEKKIDHHLNETIKLINKRVSRI